MATIAIFRGKGWKSAVAGAVTLLLALAAFALDASPAFASGTVNVSVQGKGDVSGAGVNCNESGGPDCSEFYANERVCENDPETGRPICSFQSPYVEFTAGADRNGFVYDGWTNCDTVTDRVCGLTVTADRGVTARFRDAQAPSVSNLSPSSGVQRGTITLSAGASDNSGSVSRVEFRVRGFLVAMDTTAPYSTSFDTPSVSDGAATIRATAFDAANNSSFTESTVTIDNTAPTLTITGGPDGQTFGPGTTQAWAFSAGDANLASVQCSVVPTGSAPSYGPCSGGNGSHSVTNKPDGNYTFTVRARDNGGLETTRTRSFSIDATPPNTTITGGPAEGTFTNQTSATFNFTSTETGSTFECRVYPAALTPPAFGTCSGTGSHTASGFSPGTYTFDVRATDAVGNTDSSPASRTWTVDTLKPTISGMSPRHRSTIRDTTPIIRANVKDNAPLAKANVNLYVGGRLISATKYSYTASTGALVYSSPKLTLGKKTIKIVATDLAKNVGMKSWYFTIK